MPQRQQSDVPSWTSESVSSDSQTQRQVTVTQGTNEYYPQEKAVKTGASSPECSCVTLAGISASWPFPVSAIFPNDSTLAPHERLPEILVVPREKTPTGAAARGQFSSVSHVRLFVTP